MQEEDQLDAGNLKQVHINKTIYDYQLRRFKSNKSVEYADEEPFTDIRHSISVSDEAIKKVNVIDKLTFELNEWKVFYDFFYGSNKDKY